MGAMFAILTIFMTILLLGMVGDKDAQNRKNFTYAFCVVVVAIVVMILKCM